MYNPITGAIIRGNCSPDIMALNCVMSRHCFLLPMVRAFVVVALSFGVSNILLSFSTPCYPTVWDGEYRLTS